MRTHRRLGPIWAALGLYAAIACRQCSGFQLTLSSPHKEGRTTWLACRDVDVKQEPIWGCPPSAAVLAVIPGTILETLLENGTFSLPGPNSKDPYYEQNLKLIPDIHDVGKAYYTFWYTAEVKLEADEDSSEAAFWLHFKGINYRATVFANGIFLGSMAAAFTEDWFRLPNSCASRGQVLIAVKVEPVDHVGKVNGSQGGDHQIARNAAAPQFSAGWDWIQGTPDRQTGIWDDVVLHRTRKCSIRYPFVNTLSIKFPSGLELSAPMGGFSNKSRAVLVLEETASQQHARAAELSFGMLIVNGDAEDVDLVLVFEVLAEPSMHTFAVSTTNFSLQAFETMEVTNLTLTVTPEEVDSLLQLWFPHTHGTPSLYTGRFSLRLSTGSDSLTLLDSEDIRFGIRIVDAIPDPGGSGGYAFRCNGRKIFLAGGNWIATDQLLRYASNATRYMAEVRLHREMGLNTLRVWGGGLAERDGFYNAADKLGMLVMQELWMTGDNNGRWAGEYSWPDDHHLYLRAVEDTVLRLRSHASLLFLCGGNELHPKGKNPSGDVAAGIHRIVTSLDPTRFYIESSMAPQEANASAWLASYALAMQDGPYGPLLVPDYWQWQPGLNSDYQAAAIRIPFQPEVGSSSQPVLRSLRRFLSNASLQAFPRKGALEGAALHRSFRNESWVFHKYLTFATFNSSSISPANSSYDHVYAYGEHENIEDFCFAAQMVQRQQYQALYEGFLSRMWSARTAVFMWKSQSPWPALRGALYDYYLAPTGGYYGVKRALQETTHVQLRWDIHRDHRKPQWGVDIVSRLPHRLSNLSLSVEWLSIQGASVLRQRLPVQNVMPNAATQAGIALQWPTELDTTNATRGSNANGSPPLLLRLMLRSSAGILLSHNEQLLSGQNPAAPDYSALGRLRLEPVRVSVTVGDWTTGVDCGGSAVDPARASATVTVSLATSAAAVAFGAVLELACGDAWSSSGGDDDDRILPAFFSDGYFSVLPGEDRAVCVDVSWLQLRRECSQAHIRIEGWNVVTLVVPFSAGYQLEVLQ